MHSRRIPSSNHHVEGRQEARAGGGGGGRVRRERKESHRQAGRRYVRDGGGGGGRPRSRARTVNRRELGKQDVRQGDIAQQLLSNMAKVKFLNFNNIRKKVKLAQQQFNFQVMQYVGLMLAMLHVVKGYSEQVKKAQHKTGK